ncbi:SPOR domain-containing protein [Pseudorhodoferax sp.]|uniref:SPOR domain-containing protein n=1 Tax=Pseudorhodoferax sp. TaxID=1993553 RepID=UPI0039E54C17
MAFFKFRARGQHGDDPPASPAESIDDMRRRARHRLIGAAVLVAIGVLGFPLLFDTQPRPVQVDIPIEIPDRDKTRPPTAAAAGRVTPAEPEAAAPPARPEPPPTVTADASLGAREEVVPDHAPAAAPPAPAKAGAEPKHEPKPAAPKPEPKPEAKPEPKKPEPKPELKPEPKPERKAPDDGARARALLDGKATPTPAAAAPAVAAADQAGRFVVQVGAFADADKARETRQRLERAGLKTYTQEVDTKDGKRIRVRVGPFSQRAEADKAVERLKGLGLQASVLSL